MLQVIQLWHVDNKPEQALLAATRWAENYPKDLGALAMSFLLQNVLGDNEAAIATLEKISALDSRPINLKINALFLEAGGHHKKAYEKYKDYVKVAPDDYEGHLGLARASSNLGEHKEALAAFHEAQALEPANPTVLLGLAEELLVTGDFGEALKTYKHALKRSHTPTEKANAMEGLVGYYSRRGQESLALKEVERSWRVKEQTASKEEMREIRLGDAPKFAAAGLRKQALRFVASGESILQASEHIGISGFYQSACAVYLELKMLDDARQCIEKAVALHKSLGYPESSFGLHQGVLHMELGEFPKALSAFQGYQRDNPEDLDVAILLAEVEHEMGNDDKALEEIGRLLRSIPAEPHAHLLAGKILVKQEKRAEALNHLEQAQKAWEVADKNFEAANECRDLLQSLK
jgi:tetratricopeptide (TPR) repeat protein